MTTDSNETTLERYQRETLADFQALEKKLSEANALISMKDEALKEISGMSNVTATDKRFIYILQNLASEALSASAESVAAWKSEHAAKVLEEAGWKMGEEARAILFEMAAELRAQRTQKPFEYTKEVSEMLWRPDMSTQKKGG